MIRFLRHEDLQTCDIRRQMGHAKVLENVGPIFSFCSQLLSIEQSVYQNLKESGLGLYYFNLSVKKITYFILKNVL